jgi:hypothetical protein
MARATRLSTEDSPAKEESEKKPLDQTVYPLPQDCQPDPVFGWDGREPFRFDAE